MAKTSVKFQNNWRKTVGGVALTSQLLTNVRTGHGTPISHLRTNTGATKRNVTPHTNHEGSMFYGDLGNMPHAYYNFVKITIYINLFM